MFENNQVTIAGEIISEFMYSHEMYGEGFYMVDILVNRLNNSYDIIPIMVSERLTNIKENSIGKFIKVNGQFRSYNQWKEGKNHLILSVFATEVCIKNELEGQKPNFIFLDGYICKPPVYRKTPLGRKITDILLAVNRPYRKSDYIPCICWGRNARYIATFEVGSRIQLEGRIQSREYIKKIGETEEKRRVYEVSVLELEVGI